MKIKTMLLMQIVGFFSSIEGEIHLDPKVSKWTKYGYGQFHPQHSEAFRGR